LILSIVAATLFLYYVCRRLGELNGDSYGAAVEFTEAVSLVSLIFIWGN
jgi:cobalamin synthase